MALYSTFFLCKPDQLAKGFPGWRPPLRKPVRRRIKHPLTGKAMTIETRQPKWPDDGGAEEGAPEFGVVVIGGRYEDYLEGRVPSFVRGQPH